MNQQYMNQLAYKKKHKRATAIRYNEEDDAPEIVAQGIGIAATKMLEVAKQHNIPLQEDPLLLQNLMNIKLGDQIPPQLYAVIAEVLFLVKQIEK